MKPVWKWARRLLAGLVEDEGLGVGDRLPPEVEMARRFGLGRSTVREALQVMADRNIGCVLVVQGADLMGIFTERDYARKLVLKGLGSADTQLADVMTARVIVVSSRHTIQECMGIMTKGRMRHLPVVDGGPLVGLVSSGDLVNAQREQQRIQIEHMEKYIAGDLA